MKEVLGAGITFVMLAVVIMIGGAILSKTQNVTLGLLGNYNSSAPTATQQLVITLGTNTGDALTTLTSLLPILALSVIGGLAIFYLLGFLGRGMM